ncbi:MAG: PSD1 and planctomycete cytochrome C domain-containing protein [Blastocatellia bacterium]
MLATGNRFKLLVLSFIGAIAVCLLTLPSQVTNAFEQGATSEQIEFFEKRVRPVFAAQCAKCHNANVKVAELDLTTAEGFRRGGESGPLVDAEHPEKSRLLLVVGYEEKLKMPPTGKLRQDELEALAAWVKMGAPWPGAAPMVAAGPAAPRSGREFTEAEKKYWAFQPMAHPALPKVAGAGWVKSPIDRFILAGLEAKGIAPPKAADKATLLRRATYDLTGLPPTEAEVRAFLADNSASAFEKVIDRLLASPRYGEKWGRNWLDVARYADSTGNDEDHRYPHAWRYRDYVIDAFNRDLPYDRFVREQLAGDLLPAEDGSEVNRRGIVATGFLSLGPKALAQQDKMRMLYDVYDEQVEVTSKAFLGLTLACARCHNHKFDPLLTRDYYSMIGIFASTRSFRDPKEFVSPPLTKPLVTRAEYAGYQERLAAYKADDKRLRFALETIVDTEKEGRIASLKTELTAYLLAARQVYQGGAKTAEVAAARRLDAGILQKWVDYLKPGDDPRQHLLAWHQAEDPAAEAKGYQAAFLTRLGEWQPKLAAWREKYRQAIANKQPLPDRPTFVDGEDRFFAEVYLGKKGPFSVDDSDQGSFTAAEWGDVTRLKGEMAALKKTMPTEPDMACAVEDGARVTQKVFIRGDIYNPGEDAPRSVPTILVPHTTPAKFEAKVEAKVEAKFEEGSGRRELAEWMTTPEHPLTARVMSNRIWGWHFGEGIVRTPDNFGRMGEKPTNPELLDWLAREFVKSGWSVKAMHRMIMLSSTYQMTTEITEAAQTADPENRLFSRFPRRRLMVEEMRDALLAIDGTIDLTMGGSLQSGTGTDGENDNKRLSVNPDSLTRRSVYVPLRRANLPTLLNLFDFGDATAMSGKRQLTNIATQALFWMNSDFVTVRSGNLAKELLKSRSLTNEGRVRSAYLKILNRPAGAEEVTESLKFVSRYLARDPKVDPQAAWQSLCRVLMASNEFVYLD